MTTTIPLPACLIGEGLGGGCQVAGARGVQWLEVLHDAPHLRPAPDARHARLERRAEGIEHDAVVVDQADERQGRRHLLAVVQLGRVAEVHRQAGVEQRVEVQVLLFEEELQEQLVEPAVDVPVDVPEVVADGVIAVVGEFDRRAAPLALALPLHPADEDLAADQLELLELVEELGVEQGNGPGLGHRGPSSEEKANIRSFSPGSPRRGRARASGPPRCPGRPARGPARPGRWSTAPGARATDAGARTPAP